MAKTLFSGTPATMNNNIRKRNSILKNANSLDINDNKIASINTQQLQQISMTGESMLIHSVQNVKEPVKYEENKGMENFYKNFSDNAIQSLLGKKSSGAWLMKSTINMNNEIHHSLNQKANSHSSFGEVTSAYNGYKNFMAGNKNLFVLDIEAISGKNKFGQEDIDQMTEYAIRKYNNAGKVLNEYTGIVGIDDAAAKKYKDMAETYGSIGLKEQKDKIALQYFAKLGHEDTTVERIPSRPGEWTVKKYTSEDAEDIMNKENIIRGVERSQEIGTDQRATAVNGVQTWQTNFNEAMDSIQNETNSGEAMLSGHNIKAYDIARINQLRARKNLSTINIPESGMFDLLPMMQHANANPNFALSIHGNNQSHLTGTTPLTQVSLVKSMLGEDYYDKSEMGAHSALADIQAFYDLVTKGSVNGKPLIDYAYNTGLKENSDSVETTLKGNKQQLFYAKNGSRKQGKIIDFTVDGFTKNIHTNDGMMIGDKGVSKVFKESVIKKGVSYTINNVSSVSMNNEYVKQMQKIYPNMAVNNLTMVHMSPVIDKNVHGADLMQKGNLDIYRIGTAEEIQAAFNNDMILYGTSTEEGYQMIPEAQKAMQRFDIADKDGHLKLDSKDTAVGSVIKDGTETLMNDSAARMMREDSYKKYSNYMDLIGEINGQLKDVNPVNYGNKKKEVMKSMIDQAMIIAQGSIPDVNSQNAMNHTLQSIIGYTDKGTGQQTVYRHTVDNVFAGLAHVESMQDNIKLLIGKVNTLAEPIENKYKKEAYKSFVFKQGLEALKSNAVKKYNENKDMKSGYVRGYNKNYVDIDVSKITGESNYTKINKAMEDINPDNILTVNLESGGEYNLINGLLNKSGAYSNSYNKDIEKKKRLSMFVDVLSEQKILDEKEITSLKKQSESYHPTIMAQQIISLLKKKKETNPELGIINPNKIHSVLGPSNFSNGKQIFAKEEVNKMLSFLDGEEYNHENFHQLRDGDNEFTSKTRSDLTDKLVNNFMIEEGPGDKVLRDKYGYSEDAIKKINILKNVHKKDTKELINQTLKAVAKTNGQVYADPYLGKFGMIFGEKFYDMSFIPQLKFKDGMFYTQVGDSAVSAHTRISYKNKRTVQSSFDLRSATGEALDNTYDLDKVVDNAIANNEDPGEKIFGHLKRISNKVRAGAESMFGSSSVSKFDEQDVKSQLEVEYKDIVNNLPELNAKGLFRDIEFFNHDKFLKSINKKNYSFEKLNDTDRQLLIRNLPNIFKAVKENSTNKDIKDVLSNPNYRAKASASESGRVRTTNVTYGFDAWMNGSRGITEQTRFVPFNENKAKASLKALGLDKDILLGNPLLTKSGRGIAERTFDGAGKTLTEIVARRTYLSSGQLGKEIEKIRGNENVPYDIRKASNIISNIAHVDEGGAVADARLADHIFNSYDIQKISYRKELEDSHEYNQETIKKVQEYSKLIPGFKIDKDGNVQFTYDAGKLVSRDEELLSLKGYGAPEVVKAKTDGVMNFGFFMKGKGTLIEEKDVADTVMNYAKSHKTKIHDANEFMTIAEKLFEASYYVDRLHAVSYRKLIENRSEKHMTAFAYMGIGASEEGKKGKINQVLKDIGLEKYSGQVLNHNIFKGFNSENIEKTVLAQMSNKELTQDTFEKAIMAAGFKSKEDFYNNISSERYLPSELLKKISGASFVLQDDHLKHKTRTAAIQSGAYEMYTDRLKDGKTEKQASEEVAGILNKGIIGDQNEQGVTVNKDGKMELADMTLEGGGKIHYNKLEAAISNDIGSKRFNNLLAANHKAYSTFGVVNDWSGITFNKVKASRREIDMLNFSKYNKYDLQEVKDKMKNDELFKSVYGHVVDLDSDGNIKHINSRSVLSSYTDQLKHQALTKKTRDQELQVQASGTAAINYNKNGSYKERLDRVGFVNKNLIDVEVPTGNDADYIDRGNMIINLKDNVIDDELLSKTNLKNKDHIAIAGHLQKRSGEEVIMPEYQKSVNSLVRIRNQIEEELNIGSKSSPQRIHRLKGQFVETVNGIDQLQSAYISGNAEGSIEKRLSTVVLDKSAIGKASVVNPKSMPEFMKKAKFDGVSLEEHAKNGKFFNASFRSKAVFEGAGFFEKDYMKSVFGKEHANLYNKDGEFIASEAEKMMEHKLSTEGIAGFVHRYPTIYKDSTRTSQIYLNKDLADNQMADMIHGAMLAKEDSDGDLSETIFARFDNKEGKRLDQYQDGSVEGFKDMKADMYTHALIHNQNAQNEINADVEKSTKNQGDMREYNRQLALSDNTNIKTDMTDNNPMLPRSSIMHTTEEVKGMSANKDALVQNTAGVVEGLTGLKRASAGEINLPNFSFRKMRDMANESLQISDKEHHALEAMLEASEEGFLSPKHADEKIVENNSIMEEYASAIRSVSGNVRQGEKTGKEPLKNWLKENALPRLRKTLYAKHGLSEDDFVNTSTNVLERMFKNANNIDEYNSFMRKGTTKFGIAADKINELLLVPQDDTSIEAENARSVKKILGDNSEEAPIFSNIKSGAESTEQKIESDLKDIPKKSISRSNMSSYEDNILSRVGEAIQKSGINARKLATGAVGLAAAIMTAGFVGGNPSTPTQQQAEDMAEDTPDDGSTYKIPQLTDTNTLKANNSGPTKGYVINVNAQSDRGKDHAVAAIQQAMGQSFSRTNVNIAMNINDQSGNITNSNIVQQIQGAIF